jgi:hypothetical protein
MVRNFSKNHPPVSDLFCFSFESETSNWYLYIPFSSVGYGTFRIVDTEIILLPSGSEMVF